MILKLVQIGNSRGIRIPKKILEKFNFNKEVKLDIKKDGLFLRNVKSSREGWADEIKEEIDSEGELKMIFSENIENEFDKKDWEW